MNAHLDASTLPRPAGGLVDRPRLLAELDRGAEGPVTVVAAPAGGGKTTLVSAWLATRPGVPVAWVAVERDETDPTRFWGRVMDALRRSGAIATGDPLATLTPAPFGGQEEFLQRLHEGLSRLPEPVCLVLDDLHELRSEEALRGLADLLGRAPAPLRTVVLTRRELRLGLHRLRLAGGLVELRAEDLGFTEEEAAALLAGAGVDVDAPALARLHERTEGWAAGLRLAALSLAGHGDAARFVAEFSGSERTVADYLLDEVLAGLAPEVRDLLLRVSVLDRVSGPLADALTDRDDGARVLAELEEANAFVLAVDVSRTWFRCHRLLADLLRGQLRRDDPALAGELHRRAATWLAAQGDTLTAVRHAQLGGDWDLAVELLGEAWVPLVLDGEEHTLAGLVAGLPPALVRSDAEVATIAAAVHLAALRWAEADALLATARSELHAVPDPRRRRAETARATVELLRARRLGALESAVEAVGAVLDDEAGPAAPELRALALMNLGIAETWTLRLPAAGPHLEHGLALGRDLGRPSIEIGCLGALGVIAYLVGRLDDAEARFREAIAIADARGWTTQPIVAVAYMTLGTLLLERGAFAEGEAWIERADPILSRAPEPAAGVALRHAQGMLATVRGRHGEALAAFRDGERLAAQLRAPHLLARRAMFWQLRARLRLGHLEPVRTALAEAGPAAAGDAEWAAIAARLRLIDGDPAAAVDALGGVLDGTVVPFHVNIEIEALLLDGVARHALGDREGAQRSAERALDLTGRQGRMWMALTVPGVDALLRDHPVHRTAHAAHLKAMLDLATGAAPAPAPAEALSERELAVLRFLPTNLSAAEIGAEMFLSVHTVKTHMRKLYAKLDAHTRAEAVERARALGLLAPPRVRG